MSLHVFLTRLIWLCVLPLVFLAVYLAGHHLYTLKAQQNREAENLIHNIATALDRNLEVLIAALQVLAASPLVDDPPRLPELYREAQGFRQSFGGHVVFADLSKQMLFNTRVDFGTTLPKLPTPKGHAAAQIVLETGKPAVGDMFLGPIAKEPLIAVVVPVIRNGQAKALLLSILSTDLFQQRLEAVALPAGWSLTLLDGKDEVIARRSPLEMGRGQAKEENPRRSVVALAVSPWSVVLEIPRSVHRAPIIATTATMFVAILAVTLVSVLGGRLASRCLARAVATITLKSLPEISRPIITEVEAVRAMLNEETATRWTAEQSLHENEQRFRHLFELSPDALFVLDSKGRFLDVNIVAEKRYGYTHEEFLKMSASELATEDLRQQVKPQVKKAIESGAQFEWEHRRKDGSKLPVEVYASPIIIDGQECILSSVRDITERKKVEEALRSERGLSDTVLDSMPGIFYMYDENRRFLRWNKNFELVSGYNGTEIAKMSPLDFFAGQDRELLQERIQDVFSTGAANVEADFVSKDGTHTPFYFTGLSVRYEDKICLVGIGIDITDRKKIEIDLENHRKHLEELVQKRTIALQDNQQALMNIVDDLNLKTQQLEFANEKLKELDHLKSMFIASMSHELRTPLNSIIGFSGILLQGLSGEINEEQRDQLGRIFRSGKHLLSLITDVIDIAKIESGKITPCPEKFDIHALIDEAVGQVRQQATDKGLTIEEKLPDVPLLIYSDRKRLLQCLLNYLSNAVKFTEKGTVTVTAGLLREEQEMVEFSVSDTGIGIAEADRSLLFGSFVRLDSHLKVTTPGTGLGLYLTKKLATEVLAGEVGMESHHGAGSRFWIRVPLVLTEKVPT